MTTHDLSIRSLRRPYQMMVLATLIAAALVGLLLIPITQADAQEAPADEASFSFVGTTPNTGNRVAGEKIDVYFQESHNRNDLTLTSCTVNGLEQTALLNLSGGLYQIVYNVGSSDEERNAGAIPVDCTFQTPSGTTVTASAWTDNNMLGIDSNNNGHIDSVTAPSFSNVGVIPTSGTLTTGDHLEIFFDEQNHHGDLTLVGACLVNNVDIGAIQNLSAGLYKGIYTVSATDTPREAGQIPVDCKLGNSSGTAHATAWTDNNTVAIAFSNDGGNNGGNGGNNGNGTSTASTAPTLGNVGVVPSTGTLTTGDVLEVFFNEQNEMNDLMATSTCTVNGVNIAPLQNLTGGLYKGIYTVSATDTPRLAGQIPVDCTLENASGSMRATAWTDNNTVAIAFDGGNGDNGGNNGGNDGNGTSTATTTDAALALTSISQSQGTASANGDYADGWKWVFHITVPNNESSLQFRFSDWLNGSNSSSTISSANNIQVSSAQSSSGIVGITATDVYSNALALTGDLDANTPGRQIEVLVEMRVPSGSTNGSYSTSYGIRSY